MTNLLSIGSKLKTWFDWAFMADGNATADFKIQFLPHSGFITALYREGNEAAVKAWVESLDRPDGDAVAEPFWRLCDGTNGTPDIRGRMIIGAGQGTGLTNRLFNDNIGAESITLDGTQVPFADHYHGTGWRSQGFIDANNDDFEFIMRSWDIPGMSFHYNGLQGAGGNDANVNGNKPGPGHSATTNQIITGNITAATNPVTIMPPAKALWYVMRTARTA
jgi:hypothetical protein